MDNEIMSIVNILKNKLLKNYNILKNREEIFLELQNRGHSLEDISHAYAIIFFELLTHDYLDFYSDPEMLTGYNRVFNKLEKFHFTNEAKTIIYRINSLGILTVEELETITFKLLEALEDGKDLKVDLIWEISNKVVDDPGNLISIFFELKEFDNNNLLKQKRVN